jgi:hypothetical protein
MTAADKTSTGLEACIIAQTLPFLRSFAGMAETKYRSDF